MQVGPTFSGLRTSLNLMNAIRRKNRYLGSYLPSCIRKGLDETRILNGDRIVSSINGVGITGYSHAKE